MRISAYPTLAALALGLAGPASAQLPWPFGPSPPEIPNPGDPKSMPACTSKYHKELQDQLAQFENLRGVQAERVLAFCDGIAQAERVLETLAAAIGMDKDAL